MRDIWELMHILHLTTSSIIQTHVSDTPHCTDSVHLYTTIPSTLHHQSNIPTPILTSSLPYTTVHHHAYTITPSYFNTILHNTHHPISIPTPPTPPRCSTPTHPTPHLQLPQFRRKSWQLLETSSTPQETSPELSFLLP